MCSLSKPTLPQLVPYIHRNFMSIGSQGSQTQSYFWATLKKQILNFELKINVFESIGQMI